MTTSTSRFFKLLATAWSFLAVLGCGMKSPQPTQKTVANYRASRPILAPPRLEDSVAQVLKEHSDADAEQLLMVADTLKAQHDFEEAAAHYLAALQRKPDLTMATYQLGCNYALWGNTELALQWLKKGVDAGFWGYAMMKDDDDLVSIQKTQEFQQLLATVKERYPAEAAKHKGGSALERPSGDVVLAGWPVILFLHGFGDGKAGYVPLARVAAQHHVAGIAVDGPVVQYEGRYNWPTDSFETTHQYLQNVLARYKDEPLDKSRVYLLGLSQGAGHAAALVALHPESYAGAIVFSPGGKPEPPTTFASAGPARPLYVTIGRREPAGNKQLAKLWADNWRKAGWPVREESHAGGHHVPRGWDSEFPKVLSWLHSAK
jgi:predicted esterase